MALYFLSFLFLNPFTNSDVIAEIDLSHKQVRAILFQYPDSAFSIADKTLKEAESAGYTWGIANSYYFKGYILEEIQNKAVAGLLMYLKAAHILENELDERSVYTYTSLMLNAGSVLHVNGKNDEAIDLYEKALKKANLYNLKDQVLKLMFNKAFAHRDRGDLAKAIEAIEVSIELSDKLKNQKLYSDSWNLLGMILMDDNRYKEAEICFLKVINNSDSSVTILSNARNNLGDLFYRQGQLEYSIAAYSQANLNAAIPGVKFDNYIGLTHVYRKMGDLSQAIKYGKAAVVVYDSIVPGDKFMQIFNMMSVMHLERGEQQLANAYSNRYFEETQKFFQSQKELIKIKNEFQVDLLLAGYYSEMAFKETEEKFSQTIIFSITFLFAAILLVHFVYKTRISSSKKKIQEILNDYS